MKNFLSNQEFQLDEILFQSRNRDYGAYNLRHESDQILTKSLFVGVFIFAAISVTPFIINSFKSEVVAPPKFTDPYILVDVVNPEVIPPVVTVKPVSPIVATTKLEIPTPRANPIKETPATSLKKTEGTNIGTETISGPPATHFTPPINIAPPVIAPVVPKQIDNSPATKVDVEAKFSKGIDGFRNGMIQNFDSSDFEGTDNVMRTTLTFIVEKDGTISDIKANGDNKDFNQEAVKSLKSIKGKWSPAKLNGENVRSYFSFPVTMKFE
ncbi:energy transducer TonB [Halpernia sp.]|uniref:energy transducer TonB n=1 Tax=Halpernia sp. TaxID=2782209 RepID=UPI003A903A4B